MIREFQAFFDLFRKGKELTNAGVWKQRTIAANTLAGVLGSALVIAKGFGFDINIDDATVQAASAGIAALVCLGNAVMHAVTSARAGLPPKADA